jgi:hypothetical protein
MTNDLQFERHTLPLIFDVPFELPQNQGERKIDALNIITARLVELIEEDKRLQGLMRRHGIEWGWGIGSWEEPEEA